jgi:toxin-antitoxin system PIN domain toxin
LVFPDVNVWLALSHPRHLHHEIAVAWLEALAESTALVFCRHTQLSWFRLMTTEAAMGPDTQTQRQCWQLYDGWVEPGKAVFAYEPQDIEEEMRLRSGAEAPNPKEWADAYLAAFSSVTGMTLITFDRALAAKAKGAVLLG